MKNIENKVQESKSTKRTKLRIESIIVLKLHTMFAEARHIVYSQPITRTTDNKRETQSSLANPRKPQPTHNPARDIEIEN